MASESSPTGDKKFDDIVAYLGGDVAFHDQVSKALEEQPLVQTEALPYDNRLDLVQPEYSVSLNDVAVYLYGRFHELCEELGLDVYARNVSPNVFRKVIISINAEMTSMSELLIKGDVVWASNTYVVGLPLSDDASVEIQAVPLEDVVVGYFHKPIIMPLSDDAHNLRLSLGDTSPPPISVGLVLESAAYIDAMGDVHTDIFKNGVVVVPLGGTGLDLRLLHFQPRD